MRHHGDLRRPRRRTRFWVGVAIGSVLLLTGVSVIGAVAALSVADVAATVSEPTPRDAEPDQSGDEAGNAAAALSYVALGDSFAAGLGGGDSAGACQRGTESYPQLLGAVPGIDLTADATCSGAVTADVGEQLAGVSAATTLVPLTVGGNDLDFPVVDACL